MKPLLASIVVAQPRKRSSRVSTRSTRSSRDAARSRARWTGSPGPPPRSRRYVAPRVRISNSSSRVPGEDRVCVRVDELDDGAAASSSRAGIQRRRSAASCPTSTMQPSRTAIAADRWTRISASERPVRGVLPIAVATSAAPWTRRSASSRSVREDMGGGDSSDRAAPFRPGRSIRSGAAAVDPGSEHRRGLRRGARVHVALRRAGRLAREPLRIPAARGRGRIGHPLRTARQIDPRTAHPGARRRHGRGRLDVDVDQDGWPDLYTANGAAGARNALYVNQHDGHFVDRAEEAASRT